MSKENLIASYEKASNKAEKELALVKEILAHLPEGVEPDDIFTNGYCASATLRFSGPLNIIAQALQPVPATFVNDGSWTIKPTSMVRDEDRGTRDVAYPIYVKNQGKDDSKARWWAQVGNHLVEVTTPYSGSAMTAHMGDDAKNWAPDSMTYSIGFTSYWLRRQKTAADIPAESLFDRWTKERDDWATEQGYNAKQMIWLRNLVMFGLAYSEAAKRATGPSNQYAGVFEEQFSEDQRAALLQFAEKHLAKGIELAGEIDRNMAVAKDWFLNFFGSHGTLGEPSRIFGQQNDNVDYATLGYLFRKETGLDGAINFVTIRHGGVVEVGYTVDCGQLLGKKHIRVQCPCKVDAHPMDWRSLREFF